MYVFCMFHKISARILLIIGVCDNTHLLYLFNCKPQLIKFFFHHFMQLIIKGRVLSRVVHIFYCFTI